jgi:hypothetical protein
LGGSPKKMPIELGVVGEKGRWAMPNWRWSGDNTHLCLGTPILQRPI